MKLAGIMREVIVGRISPTNLRNCLNFCVSLVSFCGHRAVYFDEGWKSL